MRYTLHQSLVYPSGSRSHNGEPMTVDAPEDSRYEDETVSRSEARLWIDTAPGAGSTRVASSVAGLGKDYVVWYVPVASSRVLVARWMLPSLED